MLESECRDAGVTIEVDQAVKKVSRGDGFEVETEGDRFHSTSLVVATGGLSIPKMGATAFGHELARQFDIAVRECRPALVPLTFDPRDQKDYCDLSGISAEVIASSDSQQFREKMLITHRGLSGPAILQISSYWRPGQSITLDLAPACEVFATLRESPSGRNVGAAVSALKAVFPTRLAERWMELHVPSEWTNHGITELEHQLHQWEVVPGGTEGYGKAEVTAGGVDTNELSAKTMESRKVPRLFFIGEVVDVTGHLGGFNFQWAWASGYCAGQAV
jgi:predicted Rossmann fold flavoprotein